PATTTAVTTTTPGSLSGASGFGNVSVGSSPSGISQAYGNPGAMNSGTAQLLSNLVDVKRSYGPVIVNHYNVAPVFDVYSNVDRRDLGSVGREVEQILKEETSNLPRGTPLAREAMLSAGYARIRPVLMTASAMMLGMLPMALSLGEGGEQNAPLGRAVIGGLLGATVTTLFIVPIIYSYLRTEAPANHERRLQEEEAEEERNAASAGALVPQGGLQAGDETPASADIRERRPLALGPVD